MLSMLIHITSSNFSPVSEKLPQKCVTYAMAQAVPLDIARSIDLILIWSFQLSFGFWNKHCLNLVVTKMDLGKTNQNDSNRKWLD